MNFPVKKSPPNYNFIRLVGGTFYCKHPSHTLRVGEHGYTWCEHIEKAIERSEDAEFFHAGARVSVPIFPRSGVFAVVHIDNERVGESAPMVLEYTPDFGGELKIGLGFWNPGEGCRSIRAVIIDYIRSKLHPNESLTSADIKTKCPNNAHGLRASRVMSVKAAEDIFWKQKCLWNIVMELACTPCIEDTASVNSSNFGIDESLLQGNFRGRNA